jgi:hypothetical protein
MEKYDDHSILIKTDNKKLDASEFKTVVEVIEEFNAIFKYITS